MGIRRGWIRGSGVVWMLMRLGWGLRCEVKKEDVGLDCAADCGGVGRRCPFDVGFWFASR